MFRKLCSSPHRRDRSGLRLQQFKSSQGGGWAASPCRGSSANANSGVCRLRFLRTCWIRDPKRKQLLKLRSGVLRDRRDKPLRILDLGVGSGALLCALLTEFASARGVGVDISADAAMVALGNLDARGLSDRAEIRVGDWTTDLEGSFDLIVSNPPYIPTADLPELPREVRDFDPCVALDGGFDGLAAYQRIMPESRSLLARPGWLLAEFGARQTADVTVVAKQCGFNDTMTYKDLSGLDRVLAARLL